MIKKINLFLLVLSSFDLQASDTGRAVTAPNNWIESNSGDYSLGSQIQPDEYTAGSTSATAPNHFAESDLVSDTIAYQQINQGHTLFLQATTASAFDSGLDLLASVAIQNPCTICGKVFPTSRNLKRHTRTHTLKKPYKCDECGYTTIYPGHFEEHKRTHTGVRPYKCDKCTYTCNHSSSLSKHKSVHSDQRFFCTLCDKTFSRSDNLKLHIKHKH